ncbi:MAG TPA: site-specific integrase [Candidatus Dormibacteraeota bacterium]|nr:site-specific integrase [Candidatus Dormibacteraeota bacterium]
MARKDGSQSIGKHPLKPGYYRGRVYHAGKTRWFVGTRKAEVQRQIDGFVEEQREANLPPGTVGEYLRSWFEMISPNCRITYRAFVTSTLKTHVYGQAVEKIQISQLTSAEIITYFDSRRKAGASEQTLFRIYKTLHAAFEVGVELRKFKFNPIKLPKQVKPQKPKFSNVEAFSPEDELKLLNYVAGKPWEALIRLALDSGAREAELLGLQKVDLAGNKMLIRRTLNTVVGGPVLEDLTKTDASHREIQLAPSTVAVLRKHLAANLRNAGFVFAKATGEPWDRRDFNRAWTALLKEAELPHSHFHALRHTCATRLLRDGAFIVAVSKRLGHAKPSITLDTYSHAIPEDQGALAARFEALVAGSGLT